MKLSRFSIVTSVCSFFILSGFSNSALAAYGDNPQPTAEQHAQIIGLIAKGKHSAKESSMKNAIEGASQVIEKVVQMYACDTHGGSMGFLRAWLAPDGSLMNTYGPYSLMHYTSPNACLDVIRMDNWKMPAKNIVSVRVVYQSSASGESEIQTLLFQKQSDDNWLFYSTGQV